MIKTIIFDFDGVLFDSKEIKKDAFTNMFKQYGDRIVQEVLSFHAISGGMSRFEKIKYLHKKLLNKSLSDKEIIALSQDFSTYVINNINKTALSAGVTTFLSGNFESYTYFISSGAPTEEVKAISRHYKINKYFQAIFGAPSNKHQHIKKILKDYNLSAQNIVFIGDSQKDKEAAVKNKLNFIAKIRDNSVFDSEKVSIKKFKELPEIIKNIK